MDTEEQQRNQQSLLVGSDEEADTWLCPTCRLKLAATMRRCPNDGSLREHTLGEQLSRNYQILDEIDAGGMSVVYRAKHRMMNSTVAIKMLRVQQLTDSAFRRFEKEAKVISGLDHPCIVRVRDFGMTEQGLPYMVLDYIEGTTLAQAIQLRSLSLQESLTIFVQMCDAFTHAHKKGVLHRDIKPSNIMLVGQDADALRIKVLDFGIAKIIDESGGGTLTKTGEVFGSPAYMSPEQASGKQVDRRSEIYSLGVLMFETLTGVLPFTEKDPVELALSHSVKPAPSLRSVAPTLPQTLENVILKALAKNPDQRYQSMPEVRRALIEVLSGLGSVSLGARLQKQLKKHILLGGVIAASLAIIGTTWIFVAPLDAPMPKSNITDIEAPPVFSEISGKTARQILKEHAKDEAINLNDYNSELTDDDLAAFKDSTKTRDISLQIASQIKGPGLAYLIHLKHLEKLDLNQTMLTERAMQEIGRMTQLKVLNLSKTEVNDNGLKSLSNLKALTKIDLRSENKVSNAALASLVGLDSLQEVNLSKNNWISSNGLAYLAKLPALTTLRLTITGIQDSDLKELQHFKALKVLALRRTAISDAGVAELVHTKLSKIDLGETKITDKCLPLLASMPTLEMVSLHGCKVSTLAVEELQRVRPELKIEWDSKKFLHDLREIRSRDNEIYQTTSGVAGSVGSRRIHELDASFNGNDDYW